MKQRLSVALAIEEAHTLSSDWIWGDEILARGLSKYLSQSYDCQIVDGAACRALANQEKFDFAIYFHPWLAGKIARFNLVWFQSPREGFWSHLTEAQWIAHWFDMIRSKFNGVLCASKVLTDQFAQRGLEAYYFPQFADTDVYCRHDPGGTGSSFDCIYVGNNAKGESVNRREIYPIAEFCLREGLRFGLFGAGWRSAKEWRLLLPFMHGPAAAVRVPALYSEAKIVLNVHFPSHRRFGIFTSRVYEALACEAFVVSDSVLDSEEIAKTEALLTSEPEGLVGGIVRCLETSPAKADEIRRRGRALVQKEHSAETRAKTVERIISFHC
jgi:glycosyltransferase involved in cell wall biosynthesis